MGEETFVMIHTMFTCDPTVYDVVHSQAGGGRHRHCPHCCCRSRLLLLSTTNYLGMLFFKTCLVSVFVPNTLTLQRPAHATCHSPPRALQRRPAFD